MRIEVIDKWLKEQYGVSYTELEELHEFVVEKSMKEEDKLIEEIDRLNNIINETIKYVKRLSCKGRDCEIYDDIKKEILKHLKENNNE